MISIDNSNSKGVRANSFGENALFTFWFYLINICLLEVGVCKNNKGTTNKKEVKNISTDGVDAEEYTGGVNAKEEPDTGRKNISGKSRVDVKKNLGIDWVNGEENTGGAKIKEETDRANIENNTSKTDIEEEPGKGEADRKKETGRADVKKKPGASGINKLGVGEAKNLNTDEVNKAEGRLLQR